METNNKELEKYTLDQIKDEFIGEVGTEKRTQYEQELQLEVLKNNSKNIRRVKNKDQFQCGII